jgi:prolyl oligopeptidase
MVRYERFLIGSLWRQEYGSAADPVELEWLLGYSPYHRVHPDVVYPATLFTVFGSDSRVSPVHAAKTAAAMQHANSRSPGAPPILFRRREDLGHGDSSVSRAIEVLVDHLSFLAQHTGLDLTTLDGPGRPSPGAPAGHGSGPG